MLQFVNTALNTFDDLVWGVPLIVLILATGIYLTIRLKGMQILRLPAALRYMVQNEEEGHGEVTSFGALCTAMSATIGTGNIEVWLLPLWLEAPERCSGCGSRRFSEWPPNMRRECLRSAIGR